MAKAKYLCSNNHHFTLDYTGWRPQVACPHCSSLAQYTTLAKTSSNLGFNKYQDVTALVVDQKTGEPLWLDKKGNKLKYGDSQVRYNLQQDPHGWRATGKKTRATDKYGRTM